MEASNGVAVVMVPLPAQGHLNQLLHLTRIISTRGLPVHFTGSATHNRQAKDRVHGWDPSTISNIYFNDFELPVIDPNLKNKSTDPLLPTFKAAAKFREPLGVLIRSLSSSYKRVVVVHDSLMAFAAEEASFVSNAEAYFPTSAFAVIHCIWVALGHPEKGILPDDVPHVSFGDPFDEAFSELIMKNQELMKYRSGDLYNTCEAIEGRFIDMVANFQKDKRLWSVGPFNPIEINSEDDRRHHSLEWLDKQDPHSVLYVSFGTTVSLSGDQIAELASGLERSKQKFIWVIRVADGDDGEAQVPNGFEDRVKGVGMVVKDWAPQLEILAHKSTGGFFSHCGWNSTLESLSMGVPIAAWPINSDQPRIALLITEILKVGLLVREWSRREELISSDEIEGSIRTLMASSEGNVLRKRANELGVDVRRAISDGGSSSSHLESFVAHISR
ncbi:cis-zeatin O-beta-D-glucosyltransferase [Ranunculus cassubicifolius]